MHWAAKHHKLFFFCGASNIWGREVRAGMKKLEMEDNILYMIADFP